MIQTRSGRLSMIAAVFMVGSVAAAQAQFGLVSESQELQAGREADAQIRQKYRVSSDPSYNGLIQTLGRRLASVSERPNLPCLYFVPGWWGAARRSPGSFRNWTRAHP